MLQQKQRTTCSVNDWLYSGIAHPDDVVSLCIKTCKPEHLTAPLWIKVCSSKNLPGLVFYFDVLPDRTTIIEKVQEGITAFRRVQCTSSQRLIINDLVFWAPEPLDESLALLRGYYSFCNTPIRTIKVRMGTRVTPVYDHEQDADSPFDVLQAHLNRYGFRPVESEHSKGLEAAAALVDSNLAHA